MFSRRSRARLNSLDQVDKISPSSRCNSSPTCRCVCSGLCYRLRFAVFLPDLRAVVLVLFFAGRPAFFFAGRPAFFAVFFEAFFGTFLPALRASDIPIAIACFRLVTFLPLRPLRNVPRFFSRITLAIFFDAPFEYLAII